MDQVEVEEEEIQDMHDTRVKMNDTFLEVLIPEGEPTIFHAIRYGDTDMIERQLCQGFNLNEKFEGNIVLMRRQLFVHLIW